MLIYHLKYFLVRNRGSYKMTTAELIKELAEREGVQHLEVEPYIPVAIVVDGKSVSEIDNGPCHIFVVYD